MKKTYIAGSKEYNTPEKPVCAPIFKRDFFCIQDKNNGAVKLKIYATGFYRLFVNGRELTKGYFAPYIANPDDYAYYDEYVLDDVLKAEGNNVLYVLLGNGFGNSIDGGVWNFETADYRSAPKFYLEIVQNGTELLRSDEFFEVCDSPIVFDDYRCGEWYDARKERKECDGLFTGENLRKAISVPPPKGEEKLCKAQPIKAFERISPVRINRVNGGYIYDFGVNFAGIAELNIDGENGEEIDLTFGEVLQNGELDLSNLLFGERSRKGFVQHDKYICKAGRQTWKPCFTYHGFRYVYVQGISEEQATPDLLTFIVLHSDIPQRGKFSCGDRTFGRIQDCTLRSDLSNFYYFPTDCPQREKNGWTGDAALSAEQLLYNFDCEVSLREWLSNIRKAQRADGALPGIVPTAGWGFEWGNGPAWDGVLIELTYQLYRFSGDIDILSENSEAIAKYIDYLYSRINRNGLIGFGLGDWLEAGAPSPDRYSTPVEVTDTLTCIELLRKAEEIYRILGDECKKVKAQKLEIDLTENFRKKRIKDHTVDCETQTAQAMAICLGLFEDDDKAYRNLLRIIERDGRFKAGIIGVRRLFDCLCDHGDGETAYRLITDVRNPGYAHNLELGATTLWEDFQLYDEAAGYGNLKRLDGGGILSLNHHCWGSISGWFYRRVAGLVIKSSEEVEISPCRIEKLGYAESEFERADKYVRVRWERKENEIILTVENRGFGGTVHAGGAQHKLQTGTHIYKIV